MVKWCYQLFVSCFQLKFYRKVSSSSSFRAMEQPANAGEVDAVPLATRFKVLQAGES